MSSAAPWRYAHTAYRSRAGDHPEVETDLCSRRSFLPLLRVLLASALQLLPNDRFWRLQCSDRAERDPRNGCVGWRSKESHSRSRYSQYRKLGWTRRDLLFGWMRVRRRGLPIFDIQSKVILNSRPGRSSRFGHLCHPQTPATNLLLVFPSFSQNPIAYLLLQHFWVLGLPQTCIEFSREFDRLPVYDRGSEKRFHAWNVEDFGIGQVASSVTVHSGRGGKGRYQRNAI